jgi:glutathione S-transferase
VVDEGEPDRDPILETTSGIYVGTADILNYLEGIEPVLRPEGVRARVDDLDRMLELYLIEPCLTMDAWPGTIAAHKAWHTAARAVAMVEDRLERSHFLVGDGLTVADVTGVIGLALAEEQGIPIPGRCRAWQDRLTQVPALAEARSPGASWGRTRRAA